MDDEYVQHVDDDENAQHVDKAQQVLDLYVRLINQDSFGLDSDSLQMFCGDLLADLRHLARARGWDADGMTGRAYWHFWTEVKMEEEGWDPSGPGNGLDRHQIETLSMMSEKVARLSAP